MIITGDVEEIIYKNEMNGYTVAVIDYHGEYTTCVGKFPPLHEGSRVELQGEFVKNAKYGEQFSVSSVKTLPPNTEDGIVRYLSSGLIKGIGPATANSIVSKFGKDTLYVIEFNPMRLAEVRGVSKQKAEQIASSFMEIKKMQNAVMFLQSYNISTNMAVKIYQTYLDKTEEILTNNPYKLIEDIDGVGFSTADKIAIKIGLSPTSEFRFRAGIIHIMKENSDSNGNTYIYKEELKNNVFKLMNVEEFDEIFDNTLQKLILDGNLKQFTKDEHECIMTTKYFNIERNIANKLVLLKRNFNEKEVSVAKEIAIYEGANKIELHENQKNAVQKAINSGVCVITGGPGTGKTTIVKCLLECFKMQSKKVILLAPTGRASKRLSESTNTEASTIHRALDLDFKNGNGSFFSKNESNPLSQDVIIVDEVSMVDAMLMLALLKAIKPRSQLILVGDKDQLPSVGAGNVLADILHSNIIPVVELTQIFRQSSDSYIITNAHLINQGKMPILDNSSKDFFFEYQKEPIDMLKSCIGLVTKRLPNYLHTDSNKIQVLAPMKAGVCGVDNLNKELQSVINPANNQPEIVTENTIYRLNDRVMQISNNYEQEWERPFGVGLVQKGVGVFNGDIGTITEIKKETQELTVTFDDGRQSLYTRAEFSQLVLSYAITIHKSQGSEFDVVVIPILSGASIILTRNLLYTAVTRAKKMVVLVGSKFNLKRMVDNNYTVKRYSMLCDFLIDQQRNIDFLYSAD